MRPATIPEYFTSALCPSLCGGWAAGFHCYFGPSGCWTKNSHINLVALMSRVVRPTHHSGKGLPPGMATTLD